MSRLDVSPLLRFALRLDSVASLLAGLLTCLFASALHTEVGAPARPVLAIGLFMLGYGVICGWMSRQPSLPRWAVWTVIVGNTLWVVESLLLAYSDWIAPTTLGLALLLGQAAAVAVFAELQFIGLRRSAHRVAA